MNTCLRIPPLPSVSLFLFIFAMALFVPATPGKALAADIVSVASGTGAGSLPYVISNAAADSTITFASGLGTITVSSAITINKNLTISGPEYETLTITNSSGQVFAINSSAAVSMENLSFSGCGATSLSGGVMAISDSASLTLDNCTFFNNTADDGGCIYASSATEINISNCTFESNLAEGGSSICVSNTELEVTNTLFYGNEASNNDYTAGTIQILGKTADISGCSFIYNICTFSESYGDETYPMGNAITALYADVTIKNSMFSKNISNYPNAKGGAIYAYYSDFTLINSSFENNYLSKENSYGGAVYSFNSDINLINTTLYNNTSEHASALFSINDSDYTVNILSSTIVEISTSNIASNVTYFEGGTTTIANCIITNNKGVTDIYFSGDVDATLAGGNFYGTVSGEDSSTATDISGHSPDTLLLGSLTTLSGNEADLQVLIPESNSPVIDNGVAPSTEGLGLNTDAISALAEDVRGVARYQGENWDSGAVEARLLKVTTTSVSNVTNSGATVAFSLTDSDTPLTSAGVCYDTDSSEDPAESGLCKRTTPEDDQTSFTFALSGLADGTTYYARAFATDASASVYGELLEFSTTAVSNDDDDDDGDEGIGDGDDNDDSGDGDVDDGDDNDDSGDGDIDDGDNGDNGDDGDDDNGDDGNDNNGSTLDDTLLLWRNADSHKLAYWRLNSDGVLDTSTNGSNGLVSATQTLSDSWNIESVFQAGDYKVLLLRSTVSGLVACWRLNSDGSLANNMEFVSSDAMLSSDWQLAGSAVINDAPLLFWQKDNSTRLVVWRLSSDCALQDSTRGSGWDEVAPDLDVRDNWQALGVLVQNNVPVVIWRNANNNRIAYWRLTADGLLAEADKNDTWGWVNDTGLSTSWSLTDALTVNDTPTLFWRNETSGKVAYWRLNNQSVLQNTQQSDGWGFVYEGKVNTAWNLVGAFSLFDTPALLWHNRNSGRVAVWKLNDSATLDSIQTAYENGLATNWTLFGESD